MKFGRLGAAFARLGAAGGTSSPSAPPPAPSVGNPIGLLLVLTYAS